mmetsp:Transcript_23095/g.33084  ORF Transcript_23095/g.33084 Transcript_23095/m.33084 type:complete len:170 (-) Transcript_23095:230-739(-)|eukprot:CAMPEP_0172418452 /NCGR_PEP_ID=MMETSP1064-20121228/4938_1 /TAXON_ID=202472 /ORGANISM="Aulacoseira subarctica , Strain CCAP 1002/5" /LENGTH=169 /DNA_ID=CAMNT_0013157397 /DNA_START=367 /DNA_END=876 /DNA_ORIENTATION=-
MTLDLLRDLKRPVSVVVDHEDDFGNVLSEETRRNFDIIRSIVAEDCNGSDHDGSRIREDSSLLTPPVIHLKRRKLDEVASATVKMIQDEIAHWQRSIAELEKMVADQHHTKKDGMAMELFKGDNVGEERAGIESSMDQVEMAVRSQEEPPQNSSSVDHQVTQFSGILLD